MSQENVELVRSVHPPSGTELSSLLTRDDSDPGWFARLASLLTDDFEAAGGEGIGSSAGLIAGGRGFHGLVAAWREWLGPWEAYWTEVEDFVDIGDDRVVVLVRDHGRLRGSEAEVENVSASVWTLRDGGIARIEFHTNRDQALKAVGLAK